MLLMHKQKKTYRDMAGYEKSHNIMKNKLFFCLYPDIPVKNGFLRLIEYRKVIAQILYYRWLPSAIRPGKGIKADMSF
ncbi:hypothetical protein D9D99_10045 [Escherichia coli]|nr:hypothetical protein [Escherichia coli]EEW2431363.1 hypothetical protein [Escherichia coli]